MNDFADQYDGELRNQVEAAEAIEAAKAAEDAMARDDKDASGLIGAQIGNIRVLRRERPGKRWVYVCHEQRSDREVRLRGFQLVRVARAARYAGLPVSMPSEPWRDEWALGGWDRRALTPVALGE